MRNVRIGLIGAGSLSEWGILPSLFSPELASPLDDGLWWSRRPSSNPAIQWQAEFKADVAALCDADSEKRDRLADIYRIESRYPAFTGMLRESKLDAVFCEDASREDLQGLIAQMARGGAKHLWLGSVPAASTTEAMELLHWARSHGVRLWSGRAVRRAAAHRAALALLRRGEIGDVTALTLRWSTAFCGEAGGDAALRGATYSAIDLLLAFAATSPAQVVLSEAKGSSTLLLQFTGGACATAVFAGADNWNAPLPRLEIVGTRGRSLVCEGGRTMVFYQPREAARAIAPPGLATHVSSQNINGLAEDLKAFLVESCQSQDSTGIKADDAGWIEAMRSLATMEAAVLSGQEGQFVPVERVDTESASKRPAENKQNPERIHAPVLTLPLSL